MSLRKEIEAEIYEMLDDLDPSGKNTERMKEYFSAMNDRQFYRYMDTFLNDPERNYTVAYQPCDNPVTVEFIEKICKKYKIPLYEPVYMPYVNGDVNDPPRSVHPMLVLDVPVKRLKQMVFTKNHTAINPSKIDPRTGQITGSDKVARVTTPELYSLIVEGQYNAAKEYFGPMADDTVASAAMERAIQRDGEVSINDLPDDPQNRTSLNTIGYYLIGSCLTTNLLDETGYVLPATQRAKEDSQSTIDRRKGA